MRENTRRASILLGAFMIFVLLMGAIVPLFQTNVNTPLPVEPTVAPTPTFPAPPADLQTIAFDRLYLHPTGLFAIGQPTGWEPSTPLTEPNRAAITMVNADALSVIEASVEQSNPPLFSLEQLDARFNDTYLATSWSRYGDWTETTRRVEDNQLVLDFALELNRQTYVARQVSWLEDGSIYTIRVVTPNNATDLLVYVLDNLVTTLQPFRQFADTPVNWSAYYDTVANHIIRYPQEWVVEDSAPGRPATIVAPDGTTLRLEALPNTTVSSDADAEAWALDAHPNATVLSVAPVQQGDASGSSVAYSFTTVDGEPQSGLAVLLNGADGTLHVADLRFNASSVDLNRALDEETAEATAEATEAPAVDTGENEALLAQVMQTFVILPPLNLSTAEATPTPLPTVATQEATEAPTEEADETDVAADDAEATAEATEGD